MISAVGALMLVLGIIVVVCVALSLIPTVVDRCRELSAPETLFAESEPLPPASPTVHILTPEELEHRQHEPRTRNPRVAPTHPSVREVGAVGESSNRGDQPIGGQHEPTIARDRGAGFMGGQFPRQPVTPLSRTLLHLAHVSRENGTGWRRNTPPEIVAAVDDVVKAWRATQR